MACTKLHAARGFCTREGGCTLSKSSARLLSEVLVDSVVGGGAADARTRVCYTDFEVLRTGAGS